MRLPWKIPCLFVLAACAPLLHAQTPPVFRCLGAHGEPVFSGQPCGTPAPAASNGMPGQGSALGGTCAATPQALRQAIADAFARHDVNRLAGLILWQGMDQASARDALYRLAEWLQQPLAGIAIAYATGPPATDASVATAATAMPASAGSTGAQRPTGLEVSTGDGNRRDFGVVEAGGCWWLAF